MAKQAQLDELRPVLNKVNKSVSKVDKVLDAVEAGADKATDILEDGLELVADAVPEALDSGVHISAETVRKGAHALQSPQRLALIVGISGAVLGAGLGVAGYFAMKKQLEKKLRLEFESKMDEEIENMRNFYTRLDKKQGFSTPAEAAETLGAPTISDAEEVVLVKEAADALSEYAGDEPPPGEVSTDPREGRNHRTRYDKIKVTEVPAAAEKIIEVEHTDAPVAEEPATRNVFEARRIDGWNQELEEASRDEMLPYIISFDEHEENAMAHEQNTVTYYVKDKILADERDEMLDNIEDLVGVNNLQLFGHGSRSPDTLYIRNELKEMDLEVVRRDSSFAEEVMGFTPEGDG